MQEHKEQEKGDTGDYVRIYHRDIVQEHYPFLLFSPEIVYAYGGYGSEQSGRG